MRNTVYILSMFREWDAIEKLAGGVIILCVLVAIVLFAMS
jgi:hypothetical protein